MLCVRRRSGAGPAGKGQVLASTKPRAQNRTAKGSTLLRRLPTLPIWGYYLSMSQTVDLASSY